MSAHADTWRRAEWWLAKLHVVQAWRTSTGSSVTVAVLADGVDANQADLTGRVISGPDFTASQRAPGGPNYGVIGTGLASLIAGHGHGNNGTSGIDGIAPRARILSVRVTLSPGDPLWSDNRITSRLPDDIAAGINYAVRHGARVIALPADPGTPGLTGYGGAHAAAGGSATERAAVNYALRNNVVLVAPAGDNARAGDAPNYPAAYQGVIAVGAFDKNFIKAPYSSHERYVSLTAAGSGVAVATASGYRTISSTWAASSIVAGVAALLRSHFPSLTAAEISKAMTAGTFYKPSSGASNGSGYGTVDAAKAIADAAHMSPRQASPATAGALPRQPPVAPPVATTASVITRDLVTDAIISAAVLAVLLVLITWYGGIVKRRDRQLALAGADRAQRGGLAKARTPAGPPYSGVQQARTGYAPGGAFEAAPRYHPRPALTGRSTLTSAFAPRPLAAPHPESGPAGAPRSDAWAGANGEPGHPSEGHDRRTTSAPRHDRADSQLTGHHGQSYSGYASGQIPDQPTVRHAPVSGSPPWEPAPAPTGELPWAVYPEPEPMSAREPFAPVTRQAPPESFWDPGPAGRARWEGADEGLDERQSDPAGPPVFAWNPDATEGGG